MLRTSVVRLALAVSVLGSGAGCNEAPPAAGDPSATSRTDSSGVEIVSIGVEPPGAAWVRLDSLPDLRIGTLDGPEPTRFGEIAALVPRASGGVVVAESQSRELRGFDGQGRHLWTAGGLGEGPGEFAALGTVGPFRGDSVVVFDDQADRLTFVGPDGGAGRTAGLGWNDRPFRFTSARDGGLLGRIFHFPGRGSLPDEGDDGVFRRDSTSFRWATPAGEAGPPLPGPVPDMEALVRVRGDERFVAVEAIPSPWSRFNYDAAAPGGAWVAVSDRFELRWFGPDGGLRRIVRAPGLDREFTETVVAATREALLAEAETPAARRQVEDRLEATPRPPTLPAFSGLRVDHEARLWVFSWEPGDAPARRAWVFTSDGRFLGRVDLPAGVRVEAIGADAVWGVERDAFDVPSVVRYRFTVEG